MKAEQIRAVLSFEQKLKVGSIVCCKWKTVDGKYKTKGMVSKIERFYIQVKLLQDEGKYKVGHMVKVPRFLNNQSSWNQFSRVEPVSGEYV